MFVSFRSLYDVRDIDSCTTAHLWYFTSSCNGGAILYIHSFKIAGPSSTFFIVTFCLPMNLPIAPDQALVRGLGILIGGAFATLVVLITIYMKKEKQRIVPLILTSK